MDDIISRMRAEESDLVRKLEAVRHFLAAYAGPVASASTPPAQKRASRGSAERADKFGGYGMGVIDAVASVLPGPSKNPLMTRDIIAKLEASGVAIRGKNKVNALSALLARSSRIKGHGRSGWTLADEPVDLQNYNEILGGDDAHQENDPTSEAAVGSDAAGQGVSPPSPASSNPFARFTG